MLNMLVFGKKNQMTKQDEINGESLGVRSWNLLFSLKACEKDDPSNMDTIGMIMTLVRLFTVKASGDILPSIKPIQAFIPCLLWMNGTVRLT